MAEMKEGFLCPICMTDLGDLIQLQLHFEEKHSKDGDPDFVQNLKDLFGKAKKKILISNEDEALQAFNNEFSFTEQLYGQAPVDFHPISGIHKEHFESQIGANTIQAVSHIDYFRSERSKRADMKAMDTNKLILRLERLMTSLPVDPVKRRAHEQSVVTWLPEDDVKLCPNCAKSFNITRRKHHCRLCGAVMCADCSDSVSFVLANRLIHPATIAKFSPDQETKQGLQSPSKSKLMTPKKGYDAIVSNLADFAGFSESQSHFRTCSYCKEVLQRRDERVSLVTQPPTKLVSFYSQLQRFMTEGASMSKRYREMASSLNAGEGTQEQLSEAKVLRLKLLKLAEIVDATSKKIATMEIEGEDDRDQASVKTLKSRIRTSAVNFVKETLVGLPAVPSEDELENLKQKRKREAERKIAVEKFKAQEAKLKFEQQQLQQQQPSYQLSSTPNVNMADIGVKKFLTPSPSSSNLTAVKSQISNAVDGLRQKATLGPRKSLFGPSASQPSLTSKVSYGSGFVATASEDGGPDLDPLVQQMHNLRQFISQARSAGKNDDAKLLEQNLRDLQEEYQKIQERRELEENYIHFKSVFGAKSPTKPNPGNSNDHQNDGEDLDETNPFFEDPAESNPFSVDEDGDEYDDSGKNPFF